MLEEEEKENDCRNPELLADRVTSTLELALDVTEVELLEDEDDEDEEEDPDDPDDEEDWKDEDDWTTDDDDC